MTTAIGTSYDEVPYSSNPFPQSHPDRLATLARLFAVTPPSLERCRVLELGCASGGNLIPMALSMPGAEFVGVDLSRVQVERGRATIAALALGNVRLEAMSIADVDERYGTFDYIVAHGVYSWVPSEIQEKMLAICARQLAPNGVAYISYNALPGWRMRGMIRDLMRYHAMLFPTPEARAAQARAIVDFLAKWVPTENSAYGLLLRSELESLRRSPDYYLTHDHLEENNEAIYFHQFVERAARHGLQYLAEATFSTMLAANFPTEVAETLHRIAPDVVRQEQFMDFLRNRHFRQTLLVRREVAVNRVLTPDRVLDLWVSAALEPPGSGADIDSAATHEFRGPGGKVLRTSNPVTKAAAVVLADRWPQAITIADLLAAAQALLPRVGRTAVTIDRRARATLAADVLYCYAAGLMELHAAPSPFVTRPGERPRGSPLSRLQVQSGTRVTNLRHEVIDLEPDLAHLLPLLDGERPRDVIARAAADWLMTEAHTGELAPGAVPEDSRRRLDRMLHRLSKLALLC